MECDNNPNYLQHSDIVNTLLQATSCLICATTFVKLSIQYFTTLLLKSREYCLEPGSVPCADPDIITRDTVTM